MEQQKRLRLAAALTVNAIILLAILVAVIIYQLVTIVSSKKQMDAIESEIQKYEQMTKDGEKDLNYLKSEQFLLDYAFQLGYYFPD